MRKGVDPQRAADVADAMRELARTGFLPDEQRSYAAQDRPLPLWHGQTSSQPSTVATMLRLLEVPVGARVLDVGAGSGWTTALLARLVGPRGQRARARAGPRARALGRDEPRRARHAVGRHRAGRARRRSGVRSTADGRGSWSRPRPARCPTSWSNSSTTDGGRMVIPVRSTLQVVVRTGAAHDGELARLLPLRAAALSRR